MVGVKVEHKADSILKPLFHELLIHPDYQDQEKRIGNKVIHYSLIEDNDRYVIGFLRSTLEKDLPAKINKRTKVLSPLDVAEDEGLAFGSIFLYSKELGCLFFEVNRNSIYLNSFKDFLYKCHFDSIALKDNSNFQIFLGTIFKKKEYERAINLDTYKSFRLKVHQPAKLLQNIKSINSILESQIETEFLPQLEQAAELNTDIAEIEFNVSRANLKKNGGLYKNKIVPIIKEFKNLLGYQEVRENIDIIEVHGYTTGSTAKKGIDLVGDVYSTSFKLSVPRLDANLQKTERLNCIKAIFEDEFAVLQDYI